MDIRNPFTLLIACLGAYFLASIPFGLLLVKLAGKGDVRKAGSGNIGATNVMRTGGKGLGLLTLLLDTAKGFFPVFCVIRMGLPAESASIVALCGVLGHVFTPWLKFQGGKGVATALGAVLGYHPAMVLPSLACFVLILAVLRYVSFASMVAALVLVPSALGLFGPWACLPFSDSGMAKIGPLAWILLSLLVVQRHNGNIKRLMQGTERKFGQPKSGQGNA